MNILPKKRWHVRTKDNIARVRRDEALALEEEKKRQDKLNLAESEARINFLRHQSGLPEQKRCNEVSSNTDSSPQKAQELQHVDLFADFKSHIKTTNKDLEKEKKMEQEKYEKQIGYLTYLGQDTNEALKLRSWYETAPKRTIAEECGYVENDLKNKHNQDPLTLINTLLPPEKNDTKKPASSAMRLENRKFEEMRQKIKMSKKDKKSHREDTSKKLKTKKDRRSMEIDQKQLKAVMLDKLRKDRLQREAAERLRQDALFALKETKAPEKRKNETPLPRIVQKYNSQFNPDLAKQNML